MSRSSKQLWAQKRNFTKFRLIGMQQLLHNIQPPILTESEEWQLKSARTYLGNVLRGWEGNNDKSRAAFLGTEAADCE